MNNGNRGRILSKEEVDRVFSLTKLQWKEFASTFFAPAWILKYFEYDSGVSVSGFDPTTGFGFSLQPLYQNDTNPPFMVIVGNYFPSGIVVFTAEMKKELRAEVKAALGPTYKVILKYGKMENFDSVEFLLSKV